MIRFCQVKILLSALLLTVCAVADNQTNTYRRISMDGAVAMMEQESGYIILDMRMYEPLITGFFDNEEEMAKFQKWREEQEKIAVKKAKTKTA